MNKVKQTQVVIDKKAWDFDYRLLSEIMTSRIDEFSDLYDIWEEAYKSITKEFESKDNNWIVDSNKFNSYIKTLELVYKKAWPIAGNKEVYCTEWMSKRLPELKDYASVGVFDSLSNIINKYKQCLEWSK